MTQPTFSTIPKQAPTLMEALVQTQTQMSDLKLEIKTMRAQIAVLYNITSEIRGENNAE